MKIISVTFENNQNIPKKYTCQGENINPPLSFVDIPKNTKSLALVMDDPDAPTGTFVHWVIFNINPKTSSIAENSFPPGSIQGKNTSLSNEYISPCPPPASPEQLQRGESGTHRYFFKLYALDTTLDLELNADKKDLENAMTGHILDEAHLVGFYKKE